MGALALETSKDSAALDYRALFTTTPSLLVVLDRDFMIVEANAAYCRATMTKRSEIVGRSLFDAFPDNPDDPAADGVRNLRASLGRVVKFRRADAMAVQKYDIRLPGGGFELRCWNLLNTPILGDDGNVLWIILHAEYVTDLVRIHGEGVARDKIAHDEQIVIDEQQTVKRERAETHLADTQKENVVLRADLVRIHGEGVARDKIAHDEQIVIDEQQTVQRERAETYLADTQKENVGLRADRLYLADIVESSNDAIIAKTLDGIVISWNWAAEQLFGYAPEEMIGHPSRPLYPAELANESDEILARLKQGERVEQFETKRIRKDGSELRVSLTASLIRNSAGKITGVSMILRDVTEHVHAEERLHGLQADLIHLSRWNTMGMLASTIAHELNQPMTAVVNYVRAAQNTIKDMEGEQIVRAQGYLSDAIEETKLAGSIIRTLREFIEKRESKRQRESFNAVIQEAIALSHLRAHDVRVKLHVALDPKAPWVFVDKVQIQQVVFNLIRNSIDAMQDCSDAKIDISTTCDEAGFVNATFCDTGPGIPPDIMRRLFQPFVTTKEKGMGIGLSICQSIIEAHGGRIWATPHEEKGVCFHFTLPVTEATGGTNDG